MLLVNAEIPQGLQLTKKNSTLYKSPGSGLPYCCTWLTTWQSQSSCMENSANNCRVVPLSAGLPSDVAFWREDLFNKRQMLFHWTDPFTCCRVAKGNGDFFERMNKIVQKQDSLLTSTQAEVSIGFKGHCTHSWDPARPFLFHPLPVLLEQGKAAKRWLTELNVALCVERIRRLVIVAGSAMTHCSWWPLRHLHTKQASALVCLIERFKAHYSSLTIPALKCWKEDNVWTLTKVFIQRCVTRVVKTT